MSDPGDSYELQSNVLEQPRAGTYGRRHVRIRVRDLRIREGTRVRGMAQEPASLC